MVFLTGGIKIYWIGPFESEKWGWREIRDLGI